MRHHEQVPSGDAAVRVGGEADTEAATLVLNSGAVRNLDNAAIILEPTAPPWQQLEDGTVSSQLLVQDTEQVAAAHESHPSWSGSFSLDLEHNIHPPERSEYVHIDHDTNLRVADTSMSVHQERPLFAQSASTEEHQRPLQPADVPQPGAFARYPMPTTTPGYPEAPRTLEQSFSATGWYPDLEGFGENPYSSQDPFPTLAGSDAFDFMDAFDPIHLPNRTPVLSPSSQRSNDDIPDKRFEKLKRCWPNRRDDAIRLMRTLWQDVVSHTEKNLFSQPLHPPRVPDDHRRSGSRWGLDEECRNRLQRDCGYPFSTEDLSPARRNSNNRIDHGPSTGGPVPESPYSSHSTASTAINFPSAEILDMSLDLYFRRFHSLIPFIHVPTFDAKSTPSSMLFSMCLIGLTMLNTDGATKFVRVCFLVRWEG